MSGIHRAHEFIYIGTQSIANQVFKIDDDRGARLFTDELGCLMPEFIYCPSIVYNIKTHDVREKYY